MSSSFDIATPSKSHQESRQASETTVNSIPIIVTSTVAYLLSLEIDLAIENGIKLAVRKLNLQDEESDVEPKSVTETILKSVEDFIGNALSIRSMLSFQERIMQMLGKEEEEIAKYKKPYKIFPDVAIESTDLPEPYHEATRSMVQTVFGAYRTEIEKGVTTVQQQSGLDFQNCFESSLDDLIKTIHSHACQTEVDAVHLQHDMMEILTKDVTASTRMELEKQNDVVLTASQTSTVVSAEKVEKVDKTTNTLHVEVAAIPSDRFDVGVLTQPLLPIQSANSTPESESSQSTQPVRRKRLRRASMTQEAEKANEEGSDEESSQLSYDDYENRSLSSQLSDFVISDDEVPNAYISTLGYTYRKSMTE
ncbi:uncharacterized protein FA14DRAFT_184188 [Meira miltonrushii]|uniref:Uncharacterized protein n=1 Tax=Meira miltonrushii TaxID=1280837 RepID=A0A316VGV4_9BASI|nr:uncharacterized protein FA14DRAFT_184188 [Meira miltonrushii]PWN34735.1 hypothetical protein FA14DRAFT_184188 [Meira miltonrushii]